MASAVRYNKILFVILSLVVLFVSSCRKDPKITPADTSPYSFDYPEIISEYLPPIQTPSTNLMTNEGVELGRKLFYDERLSANNTQSCGSCHLQSASFSDTSSFSLGIDGVAGNRNSMPLINLGWMNSFF